MGANTSQVSDLSDNLSLKTLVGTESISENDPFWNQLISFTFISPTCRYTSTHIEVLLDMCLHMYQNVELISFRLPYCQLSETDAFNLYRQLKDTHSVPRWTC